MGWFNLKLFTLFVSICKKFYRFGKNDQINLSTQKCFPARTTQLISDPEYSDDPRIYSLTNLQSNGKSVSWHCKQTTGRISLQLFYTALHRTGKLIHRAQTYRWNSTWWNVRSSLMLFLFIFCLPVCQCLAFFELHCRLLITALLACQKTIEELMEHASKSGNKLRWCLKVVNIT